MECRQICSCRLQKVEGCLQTVCVCGEKRLDQLKKIFLSSAEIRTLVTTMTGLHQQSECHSLVSYCSPLCANRAENVTKVRHTYMQSRCCVKVIWQHNL